MKTNKLLILALPLLLAISACDTSGSNVKSSEDESISSSESISSESSETETYSWTEEPIPEKTPEELEAEAWKNLATLGELIKSKPYAFDVFGSGVYERGGILGPGWRIFTKNHSSSFEVIETTGYIANMYGVLHVCRNCRYDCISSINGYALKTNSLEESMSVVNSLFDDLNIIANEWSYVSNNSGSAIFKTTSSAVKLYYSYLERCNTDAASEYSTIYVSVSSGGNAAILRAVNEETFVSSSIHIGRFDNPMGDDDREEEAHQFFRQAAYLDFSGAETAFDGSYKSVFGHVESNIPFPTQGNKYYFLDKFDEEKGNDSLNRVKIGFVATGDITTSYAAQLVEQGWELVEGTTYELPSQNSPYRVDLVYTPAENTTRPDLYTQGIFYINSYIAA